MKNNKFLAIGIGLIAMGLMSSCATSKKNTTKNMIARMEVKEPIPGVCDNENVIVILPFLGNDQVAAKAPKTDAELSQELNAKVTFLKDKPDYEDKGIINLIVNCKGEMVRCQIDNKTKSPELDSQIVAVFATMKSWKAATVNGQAVDSAVLFSFTIKNGKIIVS
jgi:hypothetical protein